MITVGALEAKNRARAEAPVVFVVTRRRAAASDDAIRFVTAACRELEIDAAAIDADEVADASRFLDEVGVRFVPEVLVFARGVLLERTTVASVDDARSVLSLALRRHRRPAKAADASVVHASRAADVPRSRADVRASRVPDETEA